MKQFYFFFSDYSLKTNVLNSKNFELKQNLYYDLLSKHFNFSHNKFSFFFARVNILVKTKKLIITCSANFDRDVLYTFIKINFAELYICYEFNNVFNCLDIHIHFHFGLICIQRLVTFFIFYF